MITSELIGYIQGELAKGHTREEIHKVLVADGGWTEADLSEAFRTVIPMQSQNSSPSNTITQNNIADLKTKTKSSKKIVENLIFIFIGLLCVLSWYFYQPQIINFWNSGVKNSQELSDNSWNWL